MPINNKHECMYECNNGIKCKCSNYGICEHNPKNKNSKERNSNKNESTLKQYRASGMSLINGERQSCGWTIEANSFTEAAQIAEADKTFRLHSLSDNVVY